MDEKKRYLIGGRALPAPLGGGAIGKRGAAWGGGGDPCTRSTKANQLCGQVVYAGFIPVLG